MKAAPIEMKPIFIFRIKPIATTTARTISETTAILIIKNSLLFYVPVAAISLF